MTTTDRETVAGRPAGRGRDLALFATVYLVLAVGLWWGVWSSHPSGTTTCGCGDGARFLWFFSWPSYALTHGHSLFYSSWLFHPTGINLLNDTSVIALGVGLTPITLVFGPVASMNVALTLAPALSALAMCILLRRWVQWAPAAFVGGLAYGFSPFVITESALNQLNIATLVIPPLVVMAVDELMIRQRRSPYVVGALLAALLTVQFFVSTEILLITVVFGVIAVMLVVAFAALRYPGEVTSRSGHGLRGACTALGVALVLLAYPLWFLLRGPAHLTGPIWSNGSISRYGNTLTSFWNAGVLGGPGHRFGGYQGAALPGLGYLGLGVVVIAIGGLVVWRHDRLLLLFAGLGVVAGALSLGPGQSWGVAWRLMERIPWFGDIVEIRFTVVLILCSAVMVAVVLDRCHTWTLDRHGTGDAGRAGLLAGLLAAVMLIPTVLVLWPNLPLTTRAVVLPRWYTEVGANLPPGQVVLAYPSPFSGLQSSQAWQAVNRMRWAQAGGGGPEGQPSRAGRSRAGFQVLADASLPLGPAPLPTPANLSAIRQALEQWQVTTVVVPDQADLPDYEQGRSAAYAVGLFTAATGRRPTHDHSAWVWWAVQHMGAPVPVAAASFGDCITDPPDAVSPQAVPSCVLTRGR